MSFRNRVGLRPVDEADGPGEAPGRPGLGARLSWTALCFIWGSTYLFIKVGVRSWPPLRLAAMRNLLACVATALFILLGSLVRRRPPGRVERWWAVAVFAVLNGSAFALIFWAERSLPSGQAALLVATMPLFTLPFARWWTREPVRREAVVGVLLGLGGVILASNLREGSGFAGSPGTRLAAQGALLAAAACYAASYVFGRRFVRGDRVVVTAAHLGLSGLYLLALSLAFDPPAPGRPTSAAALVALGYLALVGSALAYWLMFSLLGRMGSVQIAYITLVNPLVALALGVTFLGEDLTAGLVAGAALVVAGARLTMGSRPRRGPTERVGGRHTMPG